MNEPDLFGHVEPERGKNYVEPRGHADRPGTGPDGETCGTCGNATYKQMGKRYYKCALLQRNWTSGRGTDIRLRDPACSQWVPE